MSAQHLPDECRREFAGAIILVADDEILVRAMISDELRAEGHTVMEAANADEALEILRSHVRMDLVVTDMQMPGSIDGTELVRTIRRQWPELRVVMISGQAPEQAVRPLLDGYLPKPFSHSRLAECVRVLTPATAQPMAT